MNGVATILPTLFLDPHIAILTERSLQQKTGAEQMGKLFGWLMISRFFGTLLAQLFLVPASQMIIWTSAILSKILS
ncbi:lipid II flippase family protein [Ectobacillus sp. sgz5001026]|uniref:lipid II flippase family protein n=1 Tax=Ectobacillus sp. sgz5001026 TaxID=3242473 RepID=UPI0036D2ED40